MGNSLRLQDLASIAQNATECILWSSVGLTFANCRSRSTTVYCIPNDIYHENYTVNDRKNRKGVPFSKTLDRIEKLEYEIRGAWASSASFVLQFQLHQMQIGFFLPSLPAYLLFNNKHAQSVNFAFD